MITLMENGFIMTSNEIDKTDYLMSKKVEYGATSNIQNLPSTLYHIDDESAKILAKIASKNIQVLRYAGLTNSAFQRKHRDLLTKGYLAVIHLEDDQKVIYQLQKDKQK